ncbi:MAG: YdcF family protein [Mariniphaga sp.]
MLFIVSKLFNFFTLPVNWIFGLLILWFILKKGLPKRILLGVILFISVVFTNGLLFVSAMNAWSKPYCTPPDSTLRFEIAIVAGGSVGYSQQLQQVDYNAKGDRITEAIRLYRLGRVKKLYLSGESAFNFINGRSYAPQFLQYMRQMGVDPQDIILDRYARTSRENIANLTRLLASQDHAKPILLITSGWHMRRLLKGFEGSGLHLVPYAVDVPNIDPIHEWMDYLPSWDAAMEWQKLIHEIFGMVIA